MKQNITKKIEGLNMWVTTNNGGAVNLKSASAIIRKPLAFNHHTVYAVIYADKEYLYAIATFESRDEAIQYIEELKEKLQLEEMHVKYGLA